MHAIFQKMNNMCITFNLQVVYYMVRCKFVPLSIKQNLFVNEKIRFLCPILYILKIHINFKNTLLKTYFY